MLNMLINVVLCSNPNYMSVMTMPRYTTYTNVHQQSNKNTNHSELSDVYFRYILIKLEKLT